MGSSHAACLAMGKISGAELAALCDKGIIELMENDYVAPIADVLEGMGV